VGAVGRAPGKTSFDESESEELIPLLSVMVTTYWWPFVSPVSVQSKKGVVHDSAPGEAVAV
jgi:hypothetical protein